MTERTPPRGNLTRALVKRMRAEQESRPPAAPSAARPSPAQVREDDTVPRVVLPKDAASARTPVPPPVPVPARISLRVPAPAPAPRAVDDIEQRWDDDTPAPMWITASEERASGHVLRAGVSTSWSMPAPPAPAPALAPPVEAPPAPEPGVEPQVAPAVPPRAPPSPPLAKPAQVWHAVATAPSVLIEEPEPPPASRHAWKVALGLGAGLLIAFAALTLWPAAKAAQRAASAPAARSPELEPAVAAVQAHTAVAMAPSAASGVALASPARTEREVDERLDHGSRRPGERSGRERPARELVAAGRTAEPRARRDPPSEPNAPPHAATVPAEGVLRLTPVPVPVPAEPVARAQSAPKAAAPPSTAAPARGPSREAIVLEQVIPKFPARARRMEVTEGTVALEYTVDATGAVRDAVVVSASPAGIFDEAALGAIRRWRFQPKLKDGTPVESRKRFKFTFR